MLLMSLKKEGDTNFSLFQVSKKINAARIHQCDSLLFRSGVFISMYLKILDLLVNLVYSRTIWHKFNNKPLVLFIEGRFVKVNEVLSLSAKIFVCLKKENQCLLICFERTEMGRIFNFISFSTFLRNWYSFLITKSKRDHFRVGTSHGLISLASRGNLQR